MDLAERNDSAQAGGGPAGAAGELLLREGAALLHSGKAAEAADLFAEAALLLSEEGDMPALLRARIALGSAQRESGQLRSARETLAAVLSEARLEGFSALTVDALTLLAAVASSERQHVEALEHLVEAHGLARRKGLRERQARVLTNIGELYIEVRDYPHAVESLKAARELIRTAVPGTRTEAANLISLGDLHVEMGRNEEARRSYAEARRLAQDVGDSALEVIAIKSLAKLLVMAGDGLLAAPLYGEALARSRELGLRRSEFDSLLGLGRAEALQGELRYALSCLGDALRIASEIFDLPGQVEALLELGRLYLELKQPHRTREVLAQALEVARETDARRFELEALELKSLAAEQAGDLQAALRHERNFRQRARELQREEQTLRSELMEVHFDLEQARSRAETYRLELLEQARREAQAQVLERTRELEEAQLEVVMRLAIAAEYRDDDTGEHTARVGRNAEAIALELGWQEDEARVLSVAALLHDVGKIGVGDAVLHKPGMLAAEEFDVMQEHTTIGAGILSGGHTRLLRLAEEIALAHHERWDGKGYPLGLAGDAIPMSARIVAVADVLDALTHDRPYKRAWSTEEALAEIRRQSGTQFDPRVVAACLAAFSGENALSPLDRPPAGVRRYLSESALQRAVEPVEDAGETLAQVLSRRARTLRPPGPASGRSRGSQGSRAGALDGKRAAGAGHDQAGAGEGRERLLRESAFTDALTGLGNRRAFEVDLAAELLRAERFGDTFSILNLELAGAGVDDGMTRFAAAVQAELSLEGRLYRTGGEEFTAILVHGTGGLRDRLAAALESVRQRMLAAGAGGIEIGWGVASYPEDARSAGELIARSKERAPGNGTRRLASGY